jgi:ABC-type sulfate transport system substrate-binding protein
MLASAETAGLVKSASLNEGPHGLTAVIELDTNDNKHLTLSAAGAKAFVDYVLSDAGQEKFADWGYRPVNETVLKANKDRFPDPPGLFTIEDLGGWEKVNAELFDIEGGTIAKIEEEAGVSTAK